MTDILGQVKSELNTEPKWQWWADKAASKPGIEDDIYRGIGTAARGTWYGLRKYGEFTDWLDEKAGIPGTDVDLYHARRSLIDPLNERHFLLGLAGEVVLPDTIDVASYGLTYIPNRLLKAGKALKHWAKAKAALKYPGATDPIVDALKRYSPEDVQRMAAAGEIEGIQKGANINWMLGDNSDDIIRKLGEVDPNYKIKPLYEFDDIPTAAPLNIKGPQKTYYSNKYGEENLDKVASFMENAYITVGNTNSLRNSGRIELNGILYKVRANNGIRNVDVKAGTGLKLAPVINSRQVDAIQRSVWEWNKNTEAYVRQWFKDQGAAPHIAENYISLQKQDKGILKRLIRAANREYKRLNPDWKQADLMSTGHGKSLSKGGPDVARNLFPENLGKNAARQDKDDLPNIILQALGNPLTIEEDMLRFLVGPSWYKDFFGDMPRSAKTKWATMVGQGVDPDDALQIIWEEGGKAVRNSPFFKNWHENVEMSDSWYLGRLRTSGDFGAPPFQPLNQYGHGGWQYKKRK